MGLDAAQLRALVGKESRLIPARHEVNVPDIRHWAEVIRQDNRSYKEFEAEAKAAPPAMAMVWTMPPLWTSEPQPPTEPHERAIAMLQNAGYDVGIGIALEQKFFKPVKVGDRLSYSVTLAGVSPDVTDTQAGPGYQIDLRYTLRNQSGDVVGEQTYHLAQVSQIKTRH